MAHLRIRARDNLELDVAQSKGKEHHFTSPHSRGKNLKCSDTASAIVKAIVAKMEKCNEESVDTDSCKQDRLETTYQVTATDAAKCGFHPHPTWLRFRNRNRVDSNIFRCVESHCIHGRHCALRTSIGNLDA